MKQYQELKQVASKRNAEFQEKLATLQREQKLDQDSLDNENRKKNDSSSKIKQKAYELEEQRTKLAKLLEYIGSTEEQIGQQKDVEQSMHDEIEKAKDLCKNLDVELGKIMNDIGDARVDKFEQSRSQKKSEIIEQLKKKFPGVVGLCWMFIIKILQPDDWIAFSSAMVRLNLGFIIWLGYFY